MSAAAAAAAAAAPELVTPEQQQPQQAAPGSGGSSLWGGDPHTHLAGLSLLEEGDDDWGEASSYVAVDVGGLLTQLVESSQQQQDDSDASNSTQQQPLLQQLAHPDTPPCAILGSEQWPQLAQLLPLLLSSRSQATAGLAEQLLQQQLVPELLHCSPEPLAQLLTSLLATSAASYSPAVLRFITSGLHKLGRQWHLLDPALSDVLCAALVAALLEPLLAQQPAAPAAHGLALSLQLLQCDPMLCWWQRLNANTASSKPLKAAAGHQGLPQQLLQWAQQHQQQQQQQPPGPCSSCSSTPHAHRACTCLSASSAACSTALCNCLAVHCLAGFAGTHSGRQLLHRAAAASPQQQQHVGDVSPGQPLVLQCLQQWAQLQVAPAAAQEPSQPLPPWGPVRPASLADRGATLSAAEEGVVVGAASAQQLPAPSHEAVVQAAAATAAWAVRACREQRPWFEGHTQL